MNDYDTIKFGSIDSTSLEARRRAQSTTPPTRPLLVRADSQTGGLGRLGRSWRSPKGGLWCTLLVPVAVAPGPALGLRAGLATLVAVATSADDLRRRCTLKWPNDVMVDGKKVAGVLVEIVRGSEGAVFVLLGVGINANFPTMLLPEEVHGRATTLQEARGSSVDLEALADGLARGLLGAVRAGALAEAERGAAEGVLHGRGSGGVWSRPEGTKVEGVLQGIDANGRALVRTEAGQVEVIASAEW